MLRLLFLLLTILYFNYGASQEKIYIDEKGDTIPKSEFNSKYKESGNSLTGWTYIGEDKKRYVQLSENRYLKGKFDYQKVKSEIEKITNTKLADSSTILIEYYFKDDLCTEKRKDNIWSRDEINQRKSFTKSIKRKLNSDGIYFICLFENGIELNNKNNKDKEYFFSDENKFFRENIFLDPTTCGSFAAIKSNGETLIRNGEYRADWFANHLKDENWSLFFEDKKKG